MNEIIQDRARATDLPGNKVVVIIVDNYKCNLL